MNNQNNNGNIGRSFPSNSNQALAMLYIEKHFNENWTPEELARNFYNTLELIERVKR